MKPIRGVFVGQARHAWQSGAQRLATMRALGVQTIVVEEGELDVAPGLFSRVSAVLAPGRFRPAEIASYNTALIRLLDRAEPDFLWFEWPRRLEAGTIEAIRQRWPRCLLICFQDDNPFGDRRSAADRARWSRFVANIPRFDVHLLKRQSDLTEFTNRGARAVRLFRHGVFDPLFRPRKESAASASWPVSFVGTLLDGRAPFIAELLGRFRLPLHVFGGKWRRSLMRWRHPGRFHGPVNGDAYVDVIHRSGISLGFVSSSNRDEYTMRSFEIPGCAGFFLAERTPTHLELYTEGIEAEYFSSVEECADKAAHYIRNDEARRKVALAGYNRCLRNRYNLRDRMRETLAALFPGASLQ